MCVNKFNDLVCQAVSDHMTMSYKFQSEWWLLSNSELKRRLREVYKDEDISVHINPVSVISLETLDNVLMVVGNKLDLDGYRVPIPLPSEHQ